MKRHASLLLRVALIAVIPVLLVSASAFAQETKKPQPPAGKQDPKKPQPPVVKPDPKKPQPPVVQPDPKKPQPPVVQPDPKKPQPPKVEKLFPKTYDVADLLQKAAALPPAGGAQRADQSSALRKVVSSLLTKVDPDAWVTGRGDGSNLEIVNGTQLEIYTTAARHQAIAKILAGLHQMADAKVTVEARLYAVDQDFFNKYVEVQPGVNNTRVIKDEAVKLLDKQRLLAASNRAMIPNGQSDTILSWKKAFAFTSRYDPGVNNQPVRDIGFIGVTFRSPVTITPDPRRVRMRITQDVVDVIDMRRRQMFDPRTGGRLPFESPVYHRNSIITTQEVAAGEAFVLPVQFYPGFLRAENRRVVLLVRPMIQPAGK